jgi:archaellum component FlaC/uncharacterized protein YihD (DUF1040 family)
MRDIKRIEPLLETLRKIWLEHPDYRLMQLFGNVYRGDPYYIEDDDLLQRLESTYLPERDACINAEIPVALEGEISISKVKDLVRKVSDLQAQLRHMTKERDIQKEVADNQAWHVRDLKAQLRQVEGERDRLTQQLHTLYAKHPEDSCYGAMPKLRAEVANLRQLVEALPHTDLCAVHQDLLDGGPGDCNCFKSRATLTPAAGGTRHGTN